MFNGVSPVSAIQTASATQTSFHYDMMDTLMSTLSDLQEFDDFSPDFSIEEDVFVGEPIDIAVGMEFDFSDGIISLDDEAIMPVLGRALGADRLSLDVVVLEGYDFGLDNLGENDFHGFTLVQDQDIIPALEYEIIPFSDGQLAFTTPSAIAIAPQFDALHESASYSGIMPLSNNIVTIIYRGNGHTSGVVPPNQNLVTPGTINLLSPGTMARAGHVFAGWRDSGGNIFAPGQPIGFPTAVAGTVTLDAHWIPSIVQIVYNGGGHTGGVVPGNQSVLTPGSIRLMPQGTMVRTGHTFVGWRDTAGNVFPPEQIINFPTATAGSITLVAHWVPSVMTVTYNGNGHTSGTVPAGHTINMPGSFVVRAPGTMARTGHMFDAWRSASCGTIIFPGQTISVSGSGTIRLDALWIPSIVTINYRGNGHTGGAVPASQTLTTPGSISLRLQGTMTRANHTFVGWRDTAGNLLQAGQTVNFSTATVGTITLDAYWVRDVVTVIYSGNGHTSGTVPTGHTVNTPGSFEVRQPGNLARTGYIFDGWVSATCGTFFPAGAIVNLTGVGTLRLEAVWVAYETWYTFSVTDASGRIVEVYINHAPNPNGRMQSGTRAIVRHSGNSTGTMLILIGNSWIEGQQVAFAPGGGFFTVTNEPFARMPPPGTVVKTIISIQGHYDLAVSAVKTQFMDTFGFTPNMLTAEDKRMITQGIVHGIDDNLFFGASQWIVGAHNYNDNYFYLKAKSTTSAIFIAVFGTIAAVNAYNAVKALSVAGASGTFALITAPTGAGALGGGTVAVGSLVVAAGSAANASVAAAMMARSVDLYGRDLSMSGTVRPPAHIDFAEEIIRETQAANNGRPPRVDITSRFHLTQNEALDLGDRILGSDFVQKGAHDSWVFERNVGNEIHRFRMDVKSVAGTHDPWFSHVHFEILDLARNELVNNHIIVIP